MKKYIISSIRLTLVLMVLLCVIYPIGIALIAKISTGGGKGETLMVDGKVVGYANIGQKFDHPKYFWSRPSAVNYNASGSAGSNKGPTNPDYLKQVSDRIDTLLAYHPYLERSDIPVDMITASGSGLDPDISPKAAKIQIRRVAEKRGLSVEQVAKLVDDYTQKPLVRLFGPERVNVLKLNIALDHLTRKP